MRRWLIAAALLLAGVLASTASWAQLEVPPVARVTDPAGTLSAVQQQTLSDRLAEFEGSKGSQIAVLVLPSTEPETIEQYAIRVAETWKLGRKGIDDGVLLVVAMADRAVRIEVGYGLEGAIPDAIAKRIIEETITPRFRDSDYFGGIQAGIEQMIRVIEGEALPPPESWQQADKRFDGNSGLFELLMVAAFVFVRFMSASLGRLPAALLGAVVAGPLAFWLSGSLLMAIVIAVIIFAIAVLPESRGGGRAGRGSGGYGSGSYGGGGFSGGGGGFGGGGASGRW